MRIFLTMSFILLTMVLSLAQSTRRAKSAVYSATSDWQKVTLKATSRLATSSAATPQVASTPVSQRFERMETVPVSPTSSANVDFRPAFVGDFATNRNGWKAGNQGDYNYQIGMGRYSMRKLNTRTQQVAFSAVELPADINLNKADIFTIKVDMLADSGKVPMGGIVFGVKDSLNYSAFTLNAKGEVSIIRVANGKTFSDYMPGDYFSPGVSIEKNRNRLMIQRKGESLRFYINAQEVRTSPYQFKMLSGNGIGLMASGYWTSFQKLSVTLGP
ncbi:hypothetical protein [Spirosoma telluris]